jgi:LPS export ABC transporter protein LptC
MQESFQDRAGSHDEALADRRRSALKSRSATSLRLGAAALAVGVACVAGYFLARDQQSTPGEVPSGGASATSGATSSASSPPGLADPKADLMRDVVFESFGSGGTKRIDLEASSQSGRETERRFLEKVRARIPFMSQGKLGSALIESERAEHVPARPSALFQGNVRITTDDGLVFTTEELAYDGRDGTAISERAVRMKRKDLEIEALGMIYDEGFDAIEFLKDVKIRLRDPDDPPADILAGAACLARDQGALFLQENVRLSQGENRASSSMLEIYFGDDYKVTRAVFRDGFEVVVASDSRAMGFSFPRARGRKTIRGRRLDVALGRTGEVQEIAAGPQGEMVVEPAPGDPRERREIRADYLVFKFDDAGRLKEYLGQNPSEVRFVPLDPALGEPRIVKSKDLVAIVDPATGEAENVEFIGDVQFLRGRQRGTGARATFKERDGWLKIQGDAGFEDEVKRVTLDAHSMDIDTRTGSFRAFGGVRHAQKGGISGLPLGAPQSDLLSTSRQVTYEAPSRKTTYTERVVLRAGTDELRGGEIETLETPEGPKLQAKGDVEIRAALFDMEARAPKMSYTPDPRRFLFEGGAFLRQSAFETRAPSVQVDLRAAGVFEITRLQTLGPGPVTIRASGREAEAEGLVFTPKDGRVQLDGGPKGPVKLQDRGQKLQGRRIVFFTGGDQVEVTGAADGRTETVIQRKARQ